MRSSLLSKRGFAGLGGLVERCLCLCCGGVAVVLVAVVWVGEGSLRLSQDDVEPLLQQGAFDGFVLSDSLAGMIVRLDNLGLGDGGGTHLLPDLLAVDV